MEHPVSRFLIRTAVIALCFVVAPLVADESAGQKAVLVTGASSGIGLKITETLTASGFHVYAGARKAEDLARLDAMENVSSVRLDVTVQEDIDAAAEFVKAQGRGLWGVVNNAGVALYSPLSTGPESELKLTFDVNVFGPFRVNQAFLPMLIESGGRTTVIGSISGFIPGRSGSYSMSKFAVEGYTDTLANELASTPVHVSVVEPGGFKSNIVENLKDRALALAEAGELELSDEVRAGLEESVATRQTMKEPDEVAQAVLDLMTTDTPKRRYMVTPNEEQAQITIRYALQRLLELNQDQSYAYDRDGLVALLDELMPQDKTESE
jgi:NAD(P)-dependent dehydrogenase (short-subunit alcohol dehydrogenase family)